MSVSLQATAHRDEHMMLQQMTGNIVIAEYIYIYIYVYVCVCMYVNICICDTQVCICIREHTHVYVYIYTHIYICMHAWDAAADDLWYICIHTYMYKYTCTQIFVHRYRYTHIYAWKWWSGRRLVTHCGYVDVCRCVRVCMPAATSILCCMHVYIRVSTFINFFNIECGCLYVCILVCVCAWFQYGCILVCIMSMHVCALLHGIADMKSIHTNTHKHTQTLSLYISLLHTRTHSLSHTRFIGPSE